MNPPKIRHRRLHAFYESTVLNALTLTMIVCLLVISGTDLFTIPIVCLSLCFIAMVAYSICLWVKKPREIKVNAPLSNMSFFLLLYWLIIDVIPGEFNQWWYIVPAILAVIFMIYALTSRYNRVFAICALFAGFLPAQAGGAGQPEGWATCSSVFTAGDYDLTGGGDGSLVVLKSDGTDMRNAIREAILKYDVVVFDGSNGDFELSSWVELNSLTGRTLVGVNGARFTTTFSVTQEIRDLLDALDVKSLSQRAEDNLGGTLSNGAQVAEQCELTVRQALIDYYNDPKETYRGSGIFVLNNCSNFIVRNLDFAGPGSIDLGGADLITVNACDHIWIDHCRFTDGMDGNVDIVNNSDLVTVSDCHFRYSEKSYIHPLSNLISGRYIEGGAPQKCNISWIRCFWDEGCTGRMPRACYGLNHILNCYWDCPGGRCIDTYDWAKVLVEASYFSDRSRTAIFVRDDNVEYEWRGSIWKSHPVPTSNATLSVPYSYTVDDVKAVPDKVKAEAGPTLSEPYTKELSAMPAEVDFGKVYAKSSSECRVNISSFGASTPKSLTLTAPEGVLLATSADGVFSSTVTLEAIDENMLQADVYVRAAFTQGGNVATAIEATAPGFTFTIPVKADVIALDGDRIDATLVWPLDKGVSCDRNAQASAPQVFATATFSLGEKLKIHSSKRVGNFADFTFFNPTEAIAKVVDPECYIEFDVVPAPGYVFIPKKITVNAARVATDMCLVDIEYARDSDTPEKLLSAFQPVRSSDSPYYSEIYLPIGNAGVGDAVRLKLYLYNMLDNKQLALNNFRIEGDAYEAGAGVEPIMTDEIVGPTEYFDLTGRRVQNPQSGRIYIMKAGPGNARLILYR